MMPVSMLMMLKATHREQLGLGMKMRETIIITVALMEMAWMETPRTTTN